MPDKETYHWLKDHHICTRCGKEDAEPHQTMCAECLEKSRACKKKAYAALDEDARRMKCQRSAERYERLKAQRICPKCGRKSVKGFVLCLECRLKGRRRDRERRVERRVKTDFSEGICSKCNEPVVPGKKVCAKHYDAMVRRIEAVNRRNQERKTRAHHIWVRDNDLAFQKKEKAPQRRQPTRGAKEITSLQVYHETRRKSTWKSR